MDAARHLLTICSSYYVPAAAMAKIEDPGRHGGVERGETQNQLKHSKRVNINTRHHVWITGHGRITLPPAHGGGHASSRWWRRW
jgi:hypothetical protein